ncbi:MAG TPA: FUSC family protein [Polyangia bacterium]|jgi:hypothetical protein
MLRRLTRDILTFDWSQSQPGAALTCLPALVLPLAIGVATGHPRQGMMAAAGAFSVGFGSFQALGASRRTPMLVATAGMCLSSWIGTWGGQFAPVTVGLSALWGMIYAWAWRRGPGASWIALQCLIWLIISSAYPASGLHALTRGSFVLGGGLLQMSLVSAAWRFTAIPTAVGGAARSAEPAQASASTRAVRWRQSARVGALLALAMALSQGLALPSGYWIPMTAAIVTRPELQHTFQRGMARIVGTLVGAAVATLIALALRPLPVVLAALVLLFAGACYLLVHVNYAAFAACLTSYVVFLLAMVGAPAPVTIAHRTMNTLLGGALAGLGHAAFVGLARLLDRKRARRAPLHSG